MLNSSATKEMSLQKIFSCLSPNPVTEHISLPIKNVLQTDTNAKADTHENDLCVRRESNNVTDVTVLPQGCYVLTLTLTLTLTPIKEVGV